MPHVFQLLVLRLAVFVVLMWPVADAMAAEPAALPDWQDGASVYLTGSHHAETEKTAGTAITVPGSGGSTVPTHPATSGNKAVVQAVHHEASSAIRERNDRQLAPPAAKKPTNPGQVGKTRGAAPLLPQFGFPVGTVHTTITALAIVLGLLLFCVWLLRRGTKKTSIALPAEVVSVVGRVHLATRQFAELLRVGNKLVLVAMTPNGAEPLTEVTDSAEVDRLLGLCQEHDAHSTTKAFEDVFRQLSREPVASGLFRQEALLMPGASAADTYRTHRRETGRA